MKRVWKMLTAVMLILALLLPAAGAAETGKAAYGVCTADDVRVRKQPNTSANVWFFIDAGFVAEILDVRRDGNGEVTWYKVNSAHPVPNGRTYIGYIHADFFREMTAAEIAAYLEDNATPAPTSAPTLQPSVDDQLQANQVEYDGQEVVGARGRVTESANFRSQPTTKAGRILCVIPSGSLLEVTGVPQEGTENGWYRVRYDGETGYVYSDLLKLLNAGTAPTPAPGFGTEVTDTTGTVTANGVNFRKGAGLGYEIITELSEGTEVEVLTVPDSISADTWYRVRYDGTVGYIQSNFLRVEEKEEQPGDEEEDGPVVATGVITTDGVSFRIGAGQNYSSYGTLKADTVVELLYIPDTISPEHWYRIRYNNREGYVQANFIRVVTINEEDLPMEGLYGYAKLVQSSAMLRPVPAGSYLIEWKGKGSLLRITGEAVTQGSFDWYPVFYPADSTIYYVRSNMIEVVGKDESLSAAATATPAPASPYGYVITTGSGVNLRLKPGGDSIGQVPRNTVLACVGEPENPADSDYTWYFVKYNGMYGYLRGDYVRVCTATGGDVAPSDAPAETPDPSQSTTIYGYIKLTKTGVNLRVYPQKDSQAQLPKGLILPVVGAVVPEDTYGRHCWYPVRTADGLSGYIRGDCAMLCDKDGGEVEETPAPDTETELTGATGKLKKNSNFRNAAGMDGSVITVIPANTVVQVLTIPADSRNGWYKISYNGEKGYVHASLITVLTNGDTSGLPSFEPFGYVMVTNANASVRQTPGGTSLTTVSKNTVWPIVGLSKVKNDVTWYYVRANDKTGYVSGADCFKLSPEQEKDYLAGNGTPVVTLPPSERPSSYLITTSGQLNIRESYSQDSTSVGKVNKGVVMAFVDTKQVSATVTWYKVVYDHVERWVHGGYIDVMTVAEYQAWLLANPDALPDVNDNLGYLKVIKDNVYIRNAANGSLEIDQVRQNTVMRYYTDQIGAGGTLWYQVLTPNGEFGYIRADMVVRCDENGEPLPSTGPVIGDALIPPGNHQEVTYTTLKKGDGGEGTDEGYRVANLVQELINQGYYTGTVTSDYTTQVYEAVKAFQTVKGLTVDGIAGEQTLYALYGSAKIKAADRGNLDFTIFPVEKIDWFTGGIQQLLPRGSNFKVLDLKTGIVWWAHRWAGSKHADIETLTAADTARLCQIYGVDDAQEIYDKNMWHRRPCLVTIGTRTFACSLDGMPHNPDGDTIDNNNMTGQICLHFTNSTGHSPGAPVSTSHAEAIEWAYNNCPAGKK